MYRKPISLIVAVTFVCSLMTPVPKVQAQNFLGLPEPGAMVSLSPAYEPALIKGLTVHKDNPFLFDFIVDTGNSKLAGDKLKKEGDRLIKYFFAALTIPDRDLWVNLSPYEKDRMIPQPLGQTAMGRDLLAQDYMLKQLTASLIYPEKALGKIFWDKVYAQAREQFGTINVPVNTFNKVWIVAEKASIYEHNQTAFIVSGHLKVMLEEDYLSLQKHSAAPPNDTHSIGANIIRSIIIPAIEHEVNTGRNFATLRQIFYSQILATWFKRNLKQALLSQVYADKSTVNGVNLQDPSIKEKIYQRYLQAYKKGAYNYIKEEFDPVTQQTIPRKYFSGGYDEAQLVIDQASDSAMRSADTPTGIDYALTAVLGFNGKNIRMAEINDALRKIERGVVAGAHSEAGIELDHPDIDIILTGEANSAYRVKSYVLAVVKKFLSPDELAEKFNTSPENLTVMDTTSGVTYGPQSKIVPYFHNQISLLAFQNNEQRDRFLAAVKNDPARALPVESVEPDAAMTATRGEISSAALSILDIINNLDTRPEGFWERDEKEGDFFTEGVAGSAAEREVLTRLSEKGSKKGNGMLERKAIPGSGWHEYRLIPRQYGELEDYLNKVIRQGTLDAALTIEEREGVLKDAVEKYSKTEAVLTMLSGNLVNLRMMSVMTVSEWDQLIIFLNSLRKGPGDITMDEDSFNKTVSINLSRLDDEKLFGALEKIKEEQFIAGKRAVLLFLNANEMLFPGKIAMVVGIRDRGQLEDFLIELNMEVMHQERMNPRLRNNLYEVSRFIYEIRSLRGIVNFINQVNSGNIWEKREELTGRSYGEYLHLFGSAGFTQVFNKISRGLEELQEYGRMETTELEETEQVWVAKMRSLDAVYDNGASKQRALQRLINHSIIYTVSGDEREFIGKVISVNPKIIRIDLGGRIEMPSVASITVRSVLVPSKKKVAVGIERTDVISYKDFMSDHAQVVYGGIDLTSLNNGLSVSKDANGGVTITVDRAMVERVRREGIRDATPVIINMRILPSVDQLLGL